MPGAVPVAALGAVPVAAFACAPSVPSATAHTTTAVRSRVRRVPGRPVALSMTLLLLGWGSQKEMAAARPFLQLVPTGHSGVLSCRSVHSDATVAV